MQALTGTHILLIMYLWYSIAYGMQALTAHTFVDHVFGGMLVSTVKCEECDSVSLKYLCRTFHNYVDTYVLLSVCLFICCCFCSGLYR